MSKGDDLSAVVVDGAKVGEDPIGICAAPKGIDWDAEVEGMLLTAKLGAGNDVLDAAGRSTGGVSIATVLIDVGGELRVLVPCVLSGNRW